MREVAITPEHTLVLRDAPVPHPEKGEVLVNVRAAGVNRADLLQMMGLYPAPNDAPPDVPGLEVAGVVAAVGTGVDAHGVGDAVYGLVPGGGFAEYVVGHARTFAKIPSVRGSTLTFEQAAAIPEAAITAYDALVRRAHLAAGETVLIHAVASGVGTMSVQIAHALGARPIGTLRSPDKLGKVQSLGLAEALVVRDSVFAPAVLERTSGRGADVVLDLVGGPYVSESLRAVATLGRMVVVGLVGGAKAELDLRALLQKRVRVEGTVLRSRPLEEKIECALMLSRNISPLVSNGAISAVIDAVFPLEHAAEALSLVAANKTCGKVVLKVS